MPPYETNYNNSCALFLKGARFLPWAKFICYKSCIVSPAFITAGLDPLLFVKIGDHPTAHAKIKITGPMIVR